MQAILFVCTHNAVRSPMAAALLDNAKPKAYYIQSAGLDIQDIDGFAIAVLHEIDVDISTHQAQMLSHIRDRNFDKIIALSKPAYEYAKEWVNGYAIDLEYWSIPEPIYTNNRNETLDNFRHIRDEIIKHIETDFG